MEGIAPSIPHFSPFPPFRPSSSLLCLRFQNAVFCLDGRIREKTKNGNTGTMDRRGTPRNAERRGSPKYKFAFPFSPSSDPPPSCPTSTKRFAGFETPPGWGGGGRGAQNWETGTTAPHGAEGITPSNSPSVAAPPFALPVFSWPLPSDQYRVSAVSQLWVLVWR